MPKKTVLIKTYSSVPWLIASFALLSSIANLVTGIVILATNQTAGDIALGVLTLVFAVWGMVGSILALVFIIKQNRYNRSQANFIAQVSHELRTPLTSIRMYADTLLMHRYENEDEHQELLKHMDDEIVRLEQLTEHILEAKRQKSRKQLTPITPEGVLMHSLQPYLDNPDYGSRIEFAITPPISKVSVDASDLQNVMTNLVQNALTHGGSGKIYIHMADENDFVTLSVRDEGKGIAADMIKKIFEPFERGENTTDSGIPGFGLGLSIVKDFCKQYNARIEVKNHNDQGGAIFKLSLKAADHLALLHASNDDTSVD